MSDIIKVCVDLKEYNQRHLDEHVNKSVTFMKMHF